MISLPLNNEVTWDKTLPFIGSWFHSNNERIELWKPKSLLALKYVSAYLQVAVINWLLEGKIPA